MFVFGAHFLFLSSLLATLPPPPIHHQIFREGLDAILNPPGSYCAYASVYLTVCLIRIFGLATKTYLEQQQHIGIIQVGIHGFTDLFVRFSRLCPQFLLFQR